MARSEDAVDIRPALASGLDGPGITLSPFDRADMLMPFNGGQCAMVGLLAPVPEEHLRSGRVTTREHGKVAFGSRAFEVFAKLDELRRGEPVEVLIYASEPTTIIKPPYRASWRATYIGFVPARGGAHPDGMTYRPKTTEQYAPDNTGHWALFWEVVDLAELPEAERVQTGALKGWGKSKPYVKHFRPEGPVLIDL